jgi:hypothetical protein
MKKILSSLLFFVVIVTSFLSPLSLNNKIGSLDPIQGNYVYAQGELSTSEVNTEASSSTSKEPAPVGYLNCGYTDFGCGIVNALHWIFIVGGNWLVGLSATFMDYFLNHTIQSSSYRDAGFIEQGWEILRDATNILFIFALLYLAFNMMLGNGGSSTKGKLMKIILVA